MPDPVESDFMGLVIGDSMVSGLERAGRLLHKLDVALKDACDCGCLEEPLEELREARALLRREIRALRSH